MIKPLDRRTVLKGAGVLLSLPLLEAMGSENNSSVPWKFVATKIPFGVYGPNWFPAAGSTGENYKMSPVLQELKSIKSDFTVFSNIDHKVKGGHSASHAFLTGVMKDKGKGMPEGCISIDQRIAEFINSQTRYPSLNLWSAGSSFTRMCASVEAVESPYDTFNLLFGENLSRDKIVKVEELHKQRKSILDTVMESAKGLQKKVGKGDNEKLEEYFTSVRGLEKRLTSAQKWLHKPKAKVNYKGEKLSKNRSVSDSILEDTEVYHSWYDLIFLALQTDSTRSVVLSVAGKGAFNSHIVRGDYHGLSHHGKRPEQIKMLNIVEKTHLRRWKDFIGKLKSEKTADGKSLFDSTVLLLGSGMGDGNRHTNTSLPVLLSGGGFKHGRHIDNKGGQYLSSLYLSIIRRMGYEINSFGGVSKAYSGLDTV